MVRHLFLKNDRFAGWVESCQLMGYFFPVRLTVRDDVSSARMIFAGRFQIEGVKWLIDDNRVRPVAPCPHHRGRDVPRT